MKKLPIGIQNFQEIITENYVYIDKTDYIYKLLSEGKVYFLSRPRRFGKSLLISTIENIFKARKELFEGLYIHDKWDFKEYPVIRIDMIGINKTTPEDFKESLMEKIKNIGRKNNIGIESRKYNTAFSELIEKLSQKGKVVILIDEYDKPIIDFSTKPDIALENRDILKNFYGILKATDEYTKFVLLTGVSKFSRTSIFSDLNNLNDITIHKDYALMLGYTETDIKRYFSEHIKITSEKIGISENIFKEKLQEWYNGYRFSDIEEKVYNPFSVLHLFNHYEFKNYWFESGTPTFLVNLMRERNYNLTNLEGLTLTSDTFGKYEIEDIGLEALLFQTGYLTIVDTFKRNEKIYYKLSYPNLEVKESLLNHLLKTYTSKDRRPEDVLILRMMDYLDNKDIDSFLDTVKIIMSGIPYEIVINREDYYNSIVYMCLILAGARANFEIMTNIGRLDCALELTDTIYIFEFKLDTPPEKCIEQIKEKKYYEKYQGKNKEIKLVGVNISTEEKNIGQWSVVSCQ